MQLLDLGRPVDLCYACVAQAVLIEVLTDMVINHEDVRNLVIDRYMDLYATMRNTAEDQARFDMSYWEWFTLRHALLNSDGQTNILNRVYRHMHFTCDKDESTVEKFELTLGMYQGAVSWIFNPVAGSLIDSCIVNTRIPDYLLLLIRDLRSNVDVFYSVASTWNQLP